MSKLKYIIYGEVFFLFFFCGSGVRIPGLTLARVCTLPLETALLIFFCDTGA
jgi:hypothetical protein